MANKYEHTLTLFTAEASSAEEWQKVSTNRKNSF